VELLVAPIALGLHPKGDTGIILGYLASSWMAKKETRKCYNRSHDIARSEKARCQMPYSEACLGLSGGKLHRVYFPLCGGNGEAQLIYLLALLIEGGGDHV
jgi:hypothetical protein